jgi:uncharacterized DUF497 family protein
VYINSDDLEWDDAKRAQTLRERGLDFADVVRFDWDTAMISVDMRTDYGEVRKVAFGMLEDRLTVLTYTLRDTKIRIISLRRANKREQNVYQNFRAAYRS